nr:MAG TPA: hypothetical protein [Bacteriophage sp.]
MLFYNCFSSRSTILFSSTIFNISKSCSRSLHKILKTFIFSRPSDHSHTSSFYIYLTIIVTTHTHSYFISFSNISRSIFIHSYILRFIHTKYPLFNNYTKIRRISSFFRSLIGTYINTINSCNIHIIHFLIRLRCKF